MRPGDKFVKLFNELSELLQSRTGLSKDITFNHLLRTAGETNPTVNRSNHFLKKMGELRNAIVHDAVYPEEIIADPHPEVIQRFEKTLGMIKSPTKVIPKFQREVKVFAVQDSINAALAHMQENDYSQIAVQINHEYGILSSEGIVRWLSCARHIGLADLERASVGDVYEHEDKKAHRHMARIETTDAAILAFENAIAEGIPRLQAILITNSGKPNEKPLGIITPWDLLGIANKNDLA
jgi:predicted transcriptional regulator